MCNKHLAVRLLLLLTVSALLLGLLAGCKSDPEPEPVDTQPPETDDPNNPYDADGYLKDALPSDLKFGNESVDILCWNECPTVEFGVEQLTGDSISDAVYSRNLAVESRLEVVLNWIGIDGHWPNEAGFVTAVQSSVNSGLNLYDIIATYSQSAAAIANNSLVMNLNGLPYLDLDQPWWPASLTETFQIGDNLFFVSGDLSTSLLNEMIVTFFNPALLINVNPYDLVRNNEWTLEKLMELTEDAYIDRGALGVKDKADTYGIICPYTYVDAFFYGSGLVTVNTGRDGKLEVNSDYVGEKADNLANMLQTMFHVRDSGASTGWNTQGDHTQTEFAQGLSVFLTASAGTAMTYMADVDIKYGILPMPKYDSSQADYHTTASNLITLYTLAGDCDEETATCAAAVLECLGSEGYRKVTPEMFEECMKLRYAKDSDTGEMYDIIRAGLVFDIGRVFGRQMGDIAQTAFRVTVDEPNGGSWGAQAAGVEIMLQGYLDELNEKLGL